MKPLVTALALSVSLAPAPAIAQECATGFEELNAQIQGATLQTKYKGREGDHPLVLKMKGGELVDLTGVIITAKPYESWTGDKPVVDKIGGFIVEAEPLIEAGDEEKCLVLLEQARFEIRGYKPGGSIDDASSGSTTAN